MPKSYFAENFVSFVSERLTKTSNFAYTILEGLYLENRTSSQTHTSKSKNRFVDDFKLEQLFPNYSIESQTTNSSKKSTSITIGDDADIMNDEMSSFNKHTNTKSLSTFLLSDDTYVDIKCKRKSYTTKVKLKTAVKKWSFYTFFVLLFWLLLGCFGVISHVSLAFIIPVSIGGVIVTLLLLMKTNNYVRFSNDIINNSWFYKCGRISCNLVVGLSVISVAILIIVSFVNLEYSHPKSYDPPELISDFGYGDPESNDLDSGILSEDFFDYSVHNNIADNLESLLDDWKSLRLKPLWIRDFGSGDFGSGDFDDLLSDLES